jgi:predicted permease
VAGEVALSVTLLVCAGLLVRSAIALDRTDPGFDPAGVLSARVSLSQVEYQEPARLVTALTQLSERLAAQPGVVGAGITSQMPMGPGGGSNGLVAEGRTPGPENAVETRMRLVTPSYLATMRIPLRTGRHFTDRDAAGAERVAILSEEAARRLWPGEDPIGKRFLCCEGSETDPRFKTVVGVVGNVRSQGLGADITPEFYLPLAQAPDAAWDWIQRSVSVVVRGRARDPAGLAGALRAGLRDVDPSVPLAQIRPMSRVVEASTARARFQTLLLSTLGAVGLLLAAVGIYCVVAYFVSLRVQEIGIRLALGATGASVLRLLIVQGMRPIVTGAAVGVAGALVAAQALASSLVGIGPTDPLTLASVVGLLLAVGAAATLIPARSALRIEPTTVLAG